MSTSSSSSFWDSLPPLAPRAFPNDQSMNKPHPSDQLTHRTSQKKMGRPHHEADKSCELHLSVFRELVQELKSDIVRELELIMQREFSSNFERLKNLMREKDSFNTVTDIDLDICSNHGGIISSGNGHVHPKTEILNLSAISLREADMMERRLLEEVRNAEEHNVHSDDQHLEEREVPASEAADEPEEAPTLQIMSPLRGASIAGGVDALLKVVTRGRSETLQLCLEKKLDPNLDLHDVSLEFNQKTFTHCSLLALAVLAGRRSQVSLLVGMKASLDSTYGFVAGSERMQWSGPAVSATVANNDISMLTFLLELKADLATEASNGANMIWQCSYFGRDEMLKLCLASVDAKEKVLGKAAEYQNEKGIHYSPLHISVVMGQKSCSRLLLLAKAPLDATNEKMETPLDTAIHLCRPDLVTLLVREGAQITETLRRSSSGSTATGASSVDSGITQDASRTFRHRHLRLFSAKPKRESTMAPGALEDASNSDFKGHLGRLFGKPERNPVLVRAVALGLQSQPEQVEALAKRAILEFSRTDSICLSAILEAMFAERVLRFRAKSAGKGMRERQTAILRKSKDQDGGHVFAHSIVVSSRYCYADFLSLQYSGRIPDKDMKKFIKQLAPQKRKDFNPICAIRSSDLQHVPIVVHECLVPGIHHDIRFLKVMSDANALDKIFVNSHCQAIILHAWGVVRLMAVTHCIVHFALLVFFVYVAILRNSVRGLGLHEGMSEHADITWKLQWSAMMALPFCLAELVMEFVEFLVHIEHGWAWEYLQDVRNAVDYGRILVDGGIISSFALWGYDAIEDLYFRVFLAAVCAVKWTKLLYCLTPFRSIGLPVLPILFTLNNILPSIAIMFVYLAGLAHGMVALDVFPQSFSFVILRSAMFGVTGDLGEVEEMNNPNDREDFKNWWFQLLLVFAAVGMPILFMNIFIAAMSNSYEHAITNKEQLFQSRCVMVTFSHACARNTFKKVRKKCFSYFKEEKETQKRLWYCRASEEGVE